jgi:hypothetical protein
MYANLKGELGSFSAAQQVYTEQLICPSGNPDNNLQSQYSFSHVFDLQSDSKLLSGFPETLVELLCIYSLPHNNCS